MKLVSLLVCVCTVGALQISLGQSSKFSTLKNCLAEKVRNFDETNLISRDLPSDSSAYADLNYQWNKCCGEKTPLAYLLARRPTDVQAAIKCSKQVPNVRVVPRGGGHSLGKYSFGDSETLVIHLEHMAQINVDQSKRTATIGPGANMGQIIWKLYNAGKFALPYGTCPTVGIGFVLGGGHSDFSRMWGMMVDKLLEVDMIDANGNQHIANASTNADLFWALRGGGAGSFGIVTRYKFKMVSAPGQMVQSVVRYKFGDFAYVFDAWQSYFSSNPPTKFGAVLTILVSNSIVMKFFEVQRTAGTIQGVTDILASKFPPGVSPLRVESLSFLEYIVKGTNDDSVLTTNLSDPSELANVNRHLSATSAIRCKTFYAYKLITEPEIQELYFMLQQKPKEVVVALQSLGGAINKVDPRSTAFVHRASNIYKVDIIYLGLEDGISAALPWMNFFFYKTKAIFNHRESYQNYVDPDLPDYLERYYGENLLRLMAVKRKYDPGNYFRNPQSIPPAPSP